MYTIIINDNNTIAKSKVERIMQRSSNVSTLRFLVKRSYTNSMYGELDMSEFSAYMEFMLPESHTYKTLSLSKSNDLYNDEYVEYLLPVTTVLTKEAGEVRFSVTFVNVLDLNDGTDPVQFVRKTNDATITITPLSYWRDVIVDPQLTAIDGRMLQLQMIFNELTNQMDVEYLGKVTGIQSEEGKVWLIDSDGNRVGEKADVTFEGETPVIDI